MIKIYDKRETNFNTNGLGILTTSISCNVYEELNGRYDIELELVNVDKHIAHIKEDNILKINVAGKDDQLFRIKTVEKNIKTTIVTAYHITYDLNNNFVVDVAPTNQTGLGAMQWILDRAEFPHNFICMSDISKIASARYVRKTLMEAIAGADNSILNIWGGELDRDNHKISLLTSIGADRGYKIIYGKNLKEIKWRLDISEVTTKIMPQGADELLLPELFVESPLIDNYPTPIIRKIEFPDIAINEDPEDESIPITREQAEALLRDEIEKLYNAGIDKPEISVEIDMIELSKTEEYKERYQVLETIHIGDIVTAYIPELNIDVKLKVISIIYNSLTERIEQIILGQKTINYFDKQDETIKEGIDNIKKYDIPSVLQNAKETATNLINSAMVGYVYKTNSELYILDNDNIYQAQKIWRWNINGLGYSEDGIYGTYKTAITSDGQIVADFITTGKLRGDIIDANSISINSISTSATTKIVTQTGLENLVKNSSGLNSYINWNITGNNPTCVNDPITIDNTEADMCFNLTNTIMKQTISVMQDKEYTIALNVKKGTGTSKIKIIQTNKEEVILESGINIQYDWEIFVKTFRTTGSVITIHIENSNDYLRVADIILIDGGYPKIWSSAYGEIYTPNTKIDASGIDISNPLKSSKFIASNDKVGVYKGSQKIFDVTNETTTMKNIVISDIEGSILQVGKIQQIVRTNGVDFIYVD